MTGAIFIASGRVPTTLRIVFLPMRCFQKNNPKFHPPYSDSSNSPTKTDSTELRSSSLRSTFPAFISVGVISNVPATRLGQLLLAIKDIRNDFAATGSRGITPVTMREPITPLGLIGYFVLLEQPLPFFPFEFVE